MATQNPSRAKKFYAKTLGLRMTHEDEFALVFDAGGTMLRVTIVQQVKSRPYTVLGWSDPDLPRWMRDLAKRAVAFRRYAELERDGLAVSGAWSRGSETPMATRSR